MEQNNLKYQYHLLTWGGFYNKEYKDKHGFEPGDYIYDTKEKREEYIQKLEIISRQLNGDVLMIHRTEGYNCHIRTVLHRIVNFDGKEYYSEYDMGVNYPFSAASYHLEYKWYPGFNDYVLEEELGFQPNLRDIEIVQEWITGAFTEDKQDEK